MSKITKKGNAITRYTVKKYYFDSADDRRALAEYLGSGHPITLAQKIARDVQAARATLAEKGLLDGNLLDKRAREALDQNGIPHDRLTVHKARIVREFGAESWEGILAEFVWAYEILETAKESLAAELLKRMKALRNLDVIEEFATTLGLLRERIFWRFGVFDNSQKSPENLALAKLEQVDALPEARKKAGTNRKFTADNWHDEARAAADRIRARSPHLKTKSAIAHRVVKELLASDSEFDKSWHTVRKVI